MSFAAEARLGVQSPGFPACCPLPDWWEETDAPILRSQDDFEAMWQNGALDKRTKAKAMLRAIAGHHRSTPELAVPALTYLKSVAPDYAHLIPLYEFGLVSYVDYDRPLEGYGGKSGDWSAGIVNRLAELYLAADRPHNAIAPLSYLLKVRRAEVNDHLLEVAAANLGEALIASGDPAAAVDMLLAARVDFEGDWEDRLEATLAKARAEMGLTYYLVDTRHSLPVAVGALALTGLALLVLARVRWRRRMAES